VTASKAKVAAIAEAARAELARRELLGFAEHVFPGWRNAPHLVRIAELLEAVERREIRRLVVNLPPRHGKSLLCSQLFPAWYLGRNPRRHVIMATHADDLAERNSRAARLFVEDERWPFTATLSEDSTSAARWNLREGGGVFACGVRSSVTGRGADVLILDDAQHDSGTETERETSWRWFTEIAIPRLEPGAAIIAIGTRFAEDDLFGHIDSAEDGGEWTVLRLPAIAEEADPLGRVAGEALWEDRIPLLELNDRRRAMGSRAFECQFQQNPLPLDGNVFHAAWLQRYTTLPETVERIIVSLDASAKTGVANDFSAVATLFLTQRSIFIADLWRDKVEFRELMHALTEICGHYRPTDVLVEDASAGTQLIQELQRETRLPIVPVRATGSKIGRAEAVTGLFESGRVVLPAEAPWLLEFERELLGFPNAKHDDQVDAVVQGLAHILSSEQRARTPFLLRAPP
jgi:predicted phage terminase large subunit-like protein